MHFKIIDCFCFRLYVISRLSTNLSYLDDRKVEEDERKEARTMYHDTFRALRSKTRESNLENSKAALEAALIPPSEDQVWKEKLKRVWDDVYGTSANFIGKYF